MRGGDLTDGVTGQEVRLHTPRLDQPEQRHLHREQGRLREPRLVQQFRIVAEQDVLQRKFEVQSLAHRVQRGREHREGLVQLTAHSETLAALPREQEGGAASLGDRAPDQARGRPVGREGIEGGGGRVAVRRRDHRAVVEAGAGRGQGVREVREREVRAGVEVLAEGAGLGGQRVRAAAREAQGEHAGCCARALRFGRGGGGRLLDDGVGVGAADAERGDAGPARPARLRPRNRLRQQADGAFRPVHVR
ncbi:hypothetical protein EES37_20630 [Streptomyces sp. ADI91-18]|nr:hypothetical protein EES37_20630 [Streptomyces sp. ADI91-18]